MRLLRFGLRALLFLLALAVAGALAYAWRAFPTLDGELPLPGLSAPVQLRRDAADVTHIQARNLADAYAALGYVHAQERSWQLEFNRRLMHGELSELFGPATLDTDRLFRKLGLLGAAQAQWERLPPDTRALLQAYADGINAFHANSRQALPPEFHLLGVRPGAWTPQDSLAWAMVMALDLGGNWGNEFARLQLLQALPTARLWELMPPYPGEAPATAVDLAAMYRRLGVYRGEAPTSAAPPAFGWPALAQWVAGLGAPEGIGSNDWVVAGTHTTSGKPLLANDPHLGLSAPAIWYFARIQVLPAAGGRGVDVIGATLPGLPAVVLGRTAGVAWGFTNTGPDVQDLYLEQIDPADPHRYRTPEGWAPFRQRVEVIKVKGQPDQTLVVRSTRHGPVLSDGNAAYASVVDTRRYALALRWSALDADNRTVQAGIRANEAQTVDELLAAFADYHSPMQNLVAADTQGHTAYRAIGRVPLRRPDDDLRGIAPAPGWEARYDWAGWLPASDNPQVQDAAIQARGWLATANQKIVPPDYPYFIGADWATPERAERIDTLLAAVPRHDLDSLRRVQADTVSLAALKLLPLLRATRSEHPLAAAAQAQLAGFDGDMRADRAAPLVMAVWADELTRGIVAPRIGAGRFDAVYGKRSLRSGLERILSDPQAGRWWCAPLSCEQQSSAALGRALDRIAAWQGRDVAAWRWGEAHPALSVHRPFDNVAWLAPWFDIRVPSGGDPWTVNVGQYIPGPGPLPFASRHAPSLRALYDLADPERSRFIYQAGQSGLVFSPRYRDMAPEWAAVRYRPLQLHPARWVHQATLAPPPAH